MSHSTPVDGVLSYHPWTVGHNIQLTASLFAAMSLRLASSLALFLASASADLAGDGVTFLAPTLRTGKTNANEMTKSSVYESPKKPLAGLIQSPAVGHERGDVD